MSLATHRARIVAKLDLHSTAGLVRYATTSSSAEYGSGAGGWGPGPRAGSVSAFRPGTWETSDCYLTTSPAAPPAGEYQASAKSPILDRHFRGLPTSICGPKPSTWALGTCRRSRLIVAK